jgi:copper chaperone NosL
VPGMAYQPPLIGFKQLLNFGAYSIPDIGGWLFISSGLFMLIATLKESNFMKRFKKNKVVAASMMLLGVSFLTSCGNKGPQAIKLNNDKCDYCKMSISDQRFATELITEKSKVYKFDDVNCMMGFKAENADKVANADYYIADFLSPFSLTDAKTMLFLEGDGIGSPMGGNVAAFTNSDSLSYYKERLECNTISWADINH